jgi:hypothetical protein
MSSGVMKEVQMLTKQLSKKSSALKLKQGGANAALFLSQNNASYTT